MTVCGSTTTLPNSINFAYWKIFPESVWIDLITDAGYIHVCLESLSIDNQAFEALPVTYCNKTMSSRSDVLCVNLLGYTIQDARCRSRWTTIKIRYIIHKKKNETVNAVIERNTKINVRHTTPLDLVPEYLFTAYD